MGKYVTISVKIPIEIKEMLKKLGIKPSKLLKEAIKKELRIREIEGIENEIKELKDTLSKFSREFIAESIREDRESR
ncbi:MAG: hypothetical protein QW589_07800 [Candidatus Bathyarchaeia archaeon]